MLQQEGRLLRQRQPHEAGEQALAGAAPEEVLIGAALVALRAEGRIGPARPGRAGGFEGCGVSIVVVSKREQPLDPAFYPTFGGAARG